MVCQCIATVPSVRFTAAKFQALLWPIGAYSVKDPAAWFFGGETEALTEDPVEASPVSHQDAQLLLSPQLCHFQGQTSKARQGF